VGKLLVCNRPSSAISPGFEIVLWHSPAPRSLPPEPTTSTFDSHPMPMTGYIVCHHTDRRAISPSRSLAYAFLNSCQSSTITHNDTTTANDFQSPDPPPPRPQVTLQRTQAPAARRHPDCAARRSSVFPAASRGVWARQPALGPLADPDHERSSPSSASTSTRASRSASRMSSSAGTDRRSRRRGGRAQGPQQQAPPQLEPTLLGIADPALNASLPSSSTSAMAGLNAHEAGTSAARDALVDILSGRKVVSSELGAEEDVEYGPWSTRYTGHQFGQWAANWATAAPSRCSRRQVSLADARRSRSRARAGHRSRQADGLAVLRSSVREYLGAEGE
jgi:hypothetical protein